MAQTWSDIADDPNAVEARQYRKAQVDAAWRSETRDRTSVLREFCRGRRVLDVGCVGHASRIGSDAWLHAQLAEAAAECLGVDVDEDGLRRVTAGGYDAVFCDITSDPLPAQVLDRAPFDVVVAGEVIEHLPCPQSLLTFAMRVLSPGGKLVATTPNPYAPARVRAGQRGAVIENVDHVIYAFPSGMAEMADRTGMHLALVCTVGAPFTTGGWRSAKALVVAALQRARGQRSVEPVGRLKLPVRMEYLTPLDALTIRYRRSHDRIGETSIYVLEKPIPEAMM
ncbi:MAG TPA: methyltransferase domain-containing protein [Acidimicrobiales bacterium]